METDPRFRCWAWGSLCISRIPTANGSVRSATCCQHRPSSSCMTQHSKLYIRSQPPKNSRDFWLCFCYFFHHPVCQLSPWIGFCLLTLITISQGLEDHPLGHGQHGKLTTACVIFEAWLTTSIRWWSLHCYSSEFNADSWILCLFLILGFVKGFQIMIAFFVVVARFPESHQFRPNVF